MKGRCVEPEQNERSNIMAEQSPQASTEQVKGTDTDKSPETSDKSIANASMNNAGTDSSKTIDLDKQIKQPNSTKLESKEEQRTLDNMKKILDETKDCAQTCAMEIDSLDDLDLHEGAHQFSKKSKKLKKKSAFCTIL